MVLIKLLCFNFLILITISCVMSIPLNNKKVSKNDNVIDEQKQQLLQTKKIKQQEEQQHHQQQQQQSRTDDYDYYLDKFLANYYDRYIENNWHNNYTSVSLSSPSSSFSSSAKIVRDEEVSGDSKYPNDNVNRIGKNDHKNDDDDNDHGSMEGMLSDQPVQEDGNATITEMEFRQLMRNKTREKWLATLKDNILQQLGRVNVTTIPTKSQEIKNNYNLTNIIKTIESRNDTFHEYQKEVRSFYPSCTTPKSIENTWKHEKLMNLYFNMSIPNEDTAYLASAILRLYRIPHENITHKTLEINNNNNNESNDDKLMRITIYWYVRQSKKNKDIKLRICDSKVIKENTKYVDFDVRPAAKSWFKSKNKNMGLAIMIEDQESNILKVDKLIKGASCTVGTSTQKPIPTIILDAARSADESYRVANISGRLSSSTVNIDGLLFPTIDICTIDLPKNQERHLHTITSDLCNLRRINERDTKLGDRERNMLESMLLDPSLIHIRHQRQHLAQKKSTSSLNQSDLMSNMRDRLILVKSDQVRQRHNITDS